MSKLASEFKNSSSKVNIMDSQDGFRALFENATEGIVVSNADGEIIKVNPSAEKLFGYAPDELLGQQIEVLIPSKHTQKHVGKRQSYMHNPHQRSMGVGMDLLAKRKDHSEFPVEVSLSPLVTEDGTYVIAFVIDVSFRKKQEEELRKINVGLEKRVEDRTLMLREAIIELEKSKKEIAEALEKEKELNDLKSRFVSMASHEFRTPLATILSSVSLIAKYNTAETEDKKLKHVGRVKSAVNNLTDILNDMLSLSKLEEGAMHSQPEEFDLVAFTKEIVQDMQALAKENQSIQYEHKGAEQFVNLDAKFLKHILMNLLSNAIKFSPEGKQINVMTMIEGGGLTLIVKDEGIGIDEKDQKRLFERFFRAQNVDNIPGTGLGLNIVTKYVELMKGTINFDSKLNVGTTFTIQFPL